MGESQSPPVEALRPPLSAIMVEVQALRCADGPATGSRRYAAPSRGFTGSLKGGLPMTEAEWLTAVSPWGMLEYLEKYVGSRKKNLFAAACVRRLWHLLPGPQCRQAVEMLERFVDGEVTSDELASARDAATAEGAARHPGSNQNSGIYATIAASHDDPEFTAAFAVDAMGWTQVGTSEAISRAEEQAQCDLLKDIFNNPFRPVAVDPHWLTSNVVDLARTIYEERAFERLPILSDALQDAGCENADILSHCLSEGPHVKGCWVVDLLLGKA